MRILFRNALEIQIYNIHYSILLTWKFSLKLMFFWSACIISPIIHFRSPTISNLIHSIKIADALEKKNVLPKFLYKRQLTFEHTSFFLLNSGPCLLSLMDVFILWNSSKIFGHSSLKWDARSNYYHLLLINELLKLNNF